MAGLRLNSCCKSSLSQVACIDCKMRNVKRSSDDFAKLAEYVRGENKDEPQDECVVKKTPAVRDASIENCFTFALNEMPERGDEFAVDFVGRRLNNDPYDKHSMKIPVNEDICTISLCARVIDRMVVTIMTNSDKVGSQAEQDLLEMLERTFPSTICSSSLIKDYYADLVESMRNPDSGITSHPIVIYQTIPKPIRLLLVPTEWWKAIVFNKRKALIKYLCSELDHDEIVAIHQYASTPGHTKIGVTSVSSILITFW